MAGCPVYSDSFCVISRVTRSVDPPGGNGTTTVIGLAGKAGSANTGETPASTSNAAMSLDTNDTLFPLRNRRFQATAPGECQR